LLVPGSVVGRAEERRRELAVVDVVAVSLVEDAVEHIELRVPRRLPQQPRRLPPPSLTYSLLLMTRRLPPPSLTYSLLLMTLLI